MHAHAGTCILRRLTAMTESMNEGDIYTSVATVTPFNPYTLPSCTWKDPHIFLDTKPNCRCTG